MNEVDKLTQQYEGDPAGYARAYLDYLASCFKAIDSVAVECFIRLLLAARTSGNTVFFIGNGGSAATASHFANDMSIGTRTGDNLPFRAVSLTDNVAVMTALANDEGYDRMFVDQLKVHMRDGDSLVAISASGNSPNPDRSGGLRQDTRRDRRRSDGFRRRPIARKVRYFAACPNGRKASMARVEDVHMIFDHLIGSYLIAEVKRQAAATP